MTTVGHGTVTCRTVVYREVDGRSLQLHVYAPAPGGPGAPMILDIHGGAWTHFEPGVDFFWCERLAELGFLVASAEFRLSGEAPWPACADDVRHAAAWLRANAGELGGDPDQLGIMGGSTGGHLALVAGLDPLPGGEADWVVALWPVVDVAGRFELVTSAGFGPITTRLADRLWRRAARGPGPNLDGTAARLRKIDRLRHRSPVAGAAAGRILQRLNWVQGRVPLSRALLYRQLAAAHRQTFPDGPTQMASANPLALMAEGGRSGHPPVLVLQGAGDPNTSEAMAREFAWEYRRCGGDATVEIVGRVGHSYGNIPSPEAEALVARVAAYAHARRRSVAWAVASA